jgi:predicted nucleic acid-binding protein
MEDKKTYFVLDCSVTMAWCFEDEVTEYSESIFEALLKSNAIVPSLWRLEVANVLLMAQRKKRISKIKATEFIDSLNALPIHVDHAAENRSMSSILTLAEETHLTIYDATYLELALHHALPIATLDSVLRKAAEKMKITLLAG